jgi:hypothetical protein
MGEVLSFDITSKATTKDKKTAGVASRRSLIHGTNVTVGFVDRLLFGRLLVHVRHPVGRRLVSRALSLCRDRPVGRLAVQEQVGLIGSFGLRSVSIIPFFCLLTGLRASRSS